MKTTKQIKGIMQKTADKIKTLENKVIELSYSDEIRRAAQNNEYQTAKELHEKARENAPEVGRLSDEIYTLQIVYKILEENRRAAVIEEALPIIEKATANYNGKAYGEKTKEKIYQEVKNAGFAFYFDGYLTRDRLNVAQLDKNGCCYGSDYVTVYTNYEKPFIDKENKLHFDVSTIRNNHRYTENPARLAKQIIKAHETYKKAVDNAYKAQDAFNYLLPETISHINNVSIAKSTIL